jgi:hypothetical protein
MLKDLRVSERLNSLNLRQRKYFLQVTIFILTPRGTLLPNLKFKKHFVGTLYNGGGGVCTPVPLISKIPKYSTVNDFKMLKVC